MEQLQREWNGEGGSLSAGIVKKSAVEFAVQLQKELNGEGGGSSAGIVCAICQEAPGTGCMVKTACDHIYCANYLTTMKATSLCCALCRRDVNTSEPSCLEDGNNMLEGGSQSTR